MLGNNATLQTFRSDFSVDIFFSQNLTMLRFPYGKICFLFPLAKDQSTPEKLMRDLEKAKKVRTQMCFKNRFCQKRKKITRKYMHKLNTKWPTVQSVDFSSFGIIFKFNQYMHYLQIVFFL